jgi:hypothetical protein
LSPSCYSSHSLNVTKAEVRKTKAASRLGIAAHLVCFDLSSETCCSETIYFAKAAMGRVKRQKRNGNDGLKRIIMLEILYMGKPFTCKAD